MNSLVFHDEYGILIALGAVIDLLAVVWSQPRRSTGPRDRTSLQNRYVPLQKLLLQFWGFGSQVTVTYSNSTTPKPSTACYVPNLQHCIYGPNY